MVDEGVAVPQSVGVERLVRLLLPKDLPPHVALGDPVLLHHQHALARQHHGVARRRQTG
jgi:hypothetical protein